MSLAIVHSRVNVGIHAAAVTIEIHLANGVPRLSIVGLPAMAVKESKDRVRSALVNSHFEFPIRRITINLAPADLPKESSRFDLAIALGILAASKQIPNNALNDYEFAGELALGGECRSISGVLPQAIAARNSKRILVVPEQNAAEAALVSNVEIIAIRHLLDITAHLTGTKKLSYFTKSTLSQDQKFNLDLIDVCGQTQAKRALTIAAAGHHSLLMVGPPGTGKTMLASRLPTILPPLTEEEALENAAVASIAGKKIDLTTWQQRPFRAPHHTASSVALVGGGRPPRPGEISLSHHGVLFLDELPEFNRNVLESLREPLESGVVMISRAAQQAEFPAKFQLVVALNPCPCGHLGNTQRNCRCSAEQIARYRSRISGPLLDRIDLQIEVATLNTSLLSMPDQDRNQTSDHVRLLVCNARQKQLQRSGCLNHELKGEQLLSICQLKLPAKQLLEQAMKKFNLSARSYHRILRVSRTIADLDETETIHLTHLSEALSLRCFDRQQDKLL